MFQTTNQNIINPSNNARRLRTSILQAGSAQAWVIQSRRESASLTPQRVGAIAWFSWQLRYHHGVWYLYGIYMIPGWWLNKPLWKIWVNWNDDISKHMGKYKKFQTTNQYMILLTSFNTIHNSIWLKIPYKWRVLESFMGKSSTNGPFSMAMFNNQSVNGLFTDFSLAGPPGPDWNLGHFRHA